MWRRMVPAAEIDAKQLIDQHYGSLAVAAMSTEPTQFNLDQPKQAEFAERFGLSWEEARKVKNPVALQELGCDGMALETMWRAGDCLKLAPGTYVAELLQQEKQDFPRTFTVNGFYPSMRQVSFISTATLCDCICPGIRRKRFSCPCICRVV